MSSPVSSVSPATGLHSLHCPSCNSFISLQRYIDLISDFTLCRSCGRSVNIPQLIESAYPVKQEVSRRVSKRQPNGSLASRVVPVVGQFCLFGGIE